MGRLHCEWLLYSYQSFLLEPYTYERLSPVKRLILIGLVLAASTTAQVRAQSTQPSGQVQACWIATESAATALVFVPAAWPSIGCRWTASRTTPRCGSGAAFVTLILGEMPEGTEVDLELPFD